MQAEGVLGTELDRALGDTATRAQTAHVLANTLRRRPCLRYTPTW